VLGDRTSGAEPQAAESSGTCALGPGALQLRGMARMGPQEAGSGQQLTPVLQAQHLSQPPGPGEQTHRPGIGQRNDHSSAVPDLPRKKKSL